MANGRRFTWFVDRSFHPVRLVDIAVAGLPAVVAVGEERVAGLPAKYADVYRPTLLPEGLPTAVSNSVVQCGAEAAGAQIENMEGAAFFAVAAALGVPAAEVRAVSNRVGEPFAAWRVAEACEAVARELERMIVGEIRPVTRQE